MNIDGISVRRDASLREVLGRIDASGVQLSLVLDDDGHLLGTVSDGDIRRALLRGFTLDASVIECANLKPVYVPEGTNDGEILRLLKRAHLHQMPVVDAAGRVIDIKLLDNLIDQPERDNAVVLMVGGLGRRLGDLTRSTPKPMLPVGGRPLLETIVSNFCDQGFRKFYFAVNFMGDVIERHFGDGSRFNCQVEYLRENKRLGTAGALSLISDKLEHPLIVSNGDLVLQIDFGGMVNYHLDSKSKATMAVREFEYQVPYGVIHAEGGRIVGLEEKPVQQYLISGGLYVLSPEVLSYVPHDTFFDMPKLFEDVVTRGGRASTYNIDGYWLDIGRSSDYEQAQREFDGVFTKK